MESPNNSTRNLADSARNIASLEKEVLAFWKKEQIFEKSLKKTQDKDPFIFYDGPPFATGLPHHGHFVASTIKDIIPRYWTMQGRQVLRRFGWDCHGLPVEHEIDKKLGKSAQEAVAEIGIKKYNDMCREIVQRYTSQWRESIERLGRWVDFDNDYKTMDPWFMESSWWVLKSLWDKGLVYKGKRVVPVSPTLGTVLSNFEAGSNYQMVQDPAVTVLFKVDEPNTFIAAWTTTPWTLPSNQFLCVHPELNYIKVKESTGGKTIILAEDRKSAYEDLTKSTLETLETFPGSKLVGKSYLPLFPYFANNQAEGPL